MERVFENLIANAIEAMPDGGSIRIMAERNDSAGSSDSGRHRPRYPGGARAALVSAFCNGGEKDGMGPRKTAP